MIEAFRAHFTDGRFVPLGNYAPAHLRDRLDEGEIVTLEVARDRSMKSHRHQFAEIRELWETLPEDMRELPYAASPEALRKHALCVTGYCDVETVDAGSRAAAERVGASLSQMARKAHGYAIVKIEGPLVRVYTPRSQSVRAMGAEEFQASKTRVLDWICARMGIEERGAA